MTTILTQGEASLPLEKALRVNYLGSSGSYYAYFKKYS
jgi:hypothetical protein